METCPFCAEELPQDAERCPSCGERMGELEPRASGMPGWAIALLVLAAGALLLCVLGGAMSFLVFSAAPAPALPPIQVFPVQPPPPPPPVGGIATDAQVAALAFQTGPPQRYGNTVDADRQTYSWGRHGITEIGRVRLAVRGLSFEGASGGGVTVVAGDGGGGSGSTGSGERRFTHATADDGVTTCTFAGLTFTTQEGILTLGEAQLDTLGPTRVLIVDQDGGNPVVLPGP